MNLEKLNHWLALVANVGVLIGIILVAYELRQSRQATIGETHQNLLGILHERDAWLADREFAAIVAKAEASETPLDEVEARQYAEWLYGKFNVCEHVFNRYAEGLMSDDHWQGWNGGCRSTLEPPQARIVWAQRKDWFGSEFAEYFDNHARSFE